MMSLWLSRWLKIINVNDRMNFLYSCNLNCHCSCSFKISSEWIFWSQYMIVKFYLFILREVIKWKETETVSSGLKDLKTEHTWRLSKGTFQNKHGEKRHLLKKRILTELQWTVNTQAAIYVHIHVYVCVCVYIYIYIYPCIC